MGVEERIEERNKKGYESEQAFAKLLLEPEYVDGECHFWAPLLESYTKQSVEELAKCL